MEETGSGDYYKDFKACEKKNKKMKLRLEKGTRGRDSSISIHLRGRIHTWKWTSINMVFWNTFFC